MMQASVVRGSVGDGAVTARMLDTFRRLNVPCAERGARGGKGDGNTEDFDDAIDIGVADD